MGKTNICNTGTTERHLSNMVGENVIKLIDYIKMPPIENSDIYIRWHRLMGITMGQRMGRDVSWI
jgi:hypothetical protein